MTIILLCPHCRCRRLHYFNVWWEPVWGLLSTVPNSLENKGNLTQGSWKGVGGQQAPSPPTVSWIVRGHMSILCYGASSPQSMPLLSLSPAQEEQVFRVHIKKIDYYYVHGYLHKEYINSTFRVHYNVSIHIKWHLRYSYSELCVNIWCLDWNWHILHKKAARQCNELLEGEVQYILLRVLKWSSLLQQMYQLGQAV